MSKEIILTNGTVAIEAEYKEQLIEEFNNPYIQVLPDIIPKEQIVNELLFKPKIKKDELALPKEFKLNILPRIYKVFQPLPLHIEIWNMINSLIRQGYIARNPINPLFKRYSNKLGNEILNKTYNLDADENFRTTAQCGLLIGVSGMGKSTTVQRVLSKIPPVIVHNEYQNINFSQIQVTWIKLEAPANGSIKSLTLQFFSKLDSLLGTNNMERYVSKHLSVDAMIPIMGQLANNIGLGLLVVDELQHLDKGAKQVMNYFVALMNSFGVPLLLIGTPASYSMLQQEMRIARRVTGSGAIIFNSMKNDREFEIFIKGIWKYQWLSKPVKLTKEIINIFYEKTQGICDLVVKLFVNIQKRLIEKEIEELDLELINSVWNKEFTVLQPMISAIKSNNKVKKMRFEDIQEIEDGKISCKNITETNVKEKLKKLEVAEQRITKRNKIKISELDDSDIRKIVIEGKEDNISEYQALKSKGIIVNFDEILGDEEL
ncbi:Tn7-like transposition protein C [Clostridium sp. DL-VIII]|uniref:ATP-binding protein n=1 Tax=Clostridium sp. DL-VIII TaxID=641107 RepID=UPI00023B0506|nr:ATP-binding protein [Clostridium sp. DL-VIII]EHJ01946.1 Tn7-like transposition protein C [Clostridium sp. DL-VIII]